MLKKIFIFSILFYSSSWCENKFSLIFNSNFMVITTDVPMVLNSELICYRDSIIHTIGAEFLYSSRLNFGGEDWGLAGIYYSREYRNPNNSFYWGPLYGLWIKYFATYGGENLDLSLYLGGIKCDYEIGNMFFIKFMGRVLLGLDWHSGFSSNRSDKFSLGLLPSLGIGLGLKF